MPVLALRCRVLSRPRLVVSAVIAGAAAVSVRCRMLIGPRRRRPRVRMISRTSMPLRILVSAIRAAQADWPTLMSRSLQERFAWRWRVAGGRPRRSLMVRRTAAHEFLALAVPWAVMIIPSPVGIDREGDDRDTQGGCI